MSPRTTSVDTNSVDDTSNRSTINMAVRYLVGQPAHTVLLFLILAAGGYGFYYAVDVVVPREREAIQNGYDRARDDFKAVHREDVAAFREAVKECQADAKADREMMRSLVDRRRTAEKPQN